jgi:hypothetical protein
MHLTVLNLKRYISGRSSHDQAHHTFRSAPGPHHRVGLIPPATRSGSRGTGFFIVRNPLDRVDPFSTCSK